MPDDHRCRLRVPDPLQELLVAGAGSLPVGGDGFVDELDHAGIAEAGGEGGAVLALLLDGRVLAGAVGRDSQVDQGALGLDGRLRRRSALLAATPLWDARVRGGARSRRVGDADPGRVEAATRAARRDGELADQRFDYRTSIGYVKTPPPGI